MFRVDKTLQRSPCYEPPTAHKPLIPKEHLMALTQDRVISILSAARRFYNDLQSLRSTIRSTISEIPPDPTISQCLTAIQTLQFAEELATSREADAMLLAAEERHYELSYRKNKRTAEYARRRRAGHTGKLTAPRNLTLSDLDQLLLGEATEKAVSASYATTQNTSPKTLLSHKALDHTTTQRAKAAPPNPNWNSEDFIIDAKKRSNEKHRSFNMKEPYPDIFDMSTPLSDDDCIEYNIPRRSTSDTLF